MALSFTKTDGRLHVRIDPALKDWLVRYADRRSEVERRKVTVTQVLEELVIALRLRELEHEEGRQV